MKLILSSLLVMLMASGCNNAFVPFKPPSPPDSGINNTSPTNDENLDNETDSSGNRTTTNGRTSDKYGLKKAVKDLGKGTVAIAVMFVVANGLDYVFDYVCQYQDDDSSSSSSDDDSSSSSSSEEDTPIGQIFNVEGQAEAPIWPIFNVEGQAQG